MHVSAGGPCSAQGGSLASHTCRSPLLGLTVINEQHALAVPAVLAVNVALRGASQRGTGFCCACYCCHVTDHLALCSRQPGKHAQA